MAVRDYLDYFGLTVLVDEILDKLNAKFGKIKVGAGTLTPTTSDDSVEFIGTAPVTVTANTLDNSVTIAHSNSGATAGSYGDSSAQTPDFGDTFKVTSFTVDAKGHLTAAGDHYITVPTETNSFGTIVAGGTSILSATAGDSLTLTAGLGVTLTPSAGTKTIEISAPGSLYVNKGEYVYTSTSGGETTFNLANYQDIGWYDSTKDTLLVTVDGLTLNEDMYSVSGATVTLDSALLAGSSISFKVLGFGIKGDLETLVSAYNNFISYYQNNLPYYDSVTGMTVFPVVNFLAYQVNVPQSSPVYEYAAKFNNMLTYLQANIPYYDSNAGDVVIPPIDLSTYRLNT